MTSFSSRVCEDATGRQRVAKQGNRKSSIADLKFAVVTDVLRNVHGRIFGLIRDQPRPHQNCSASHRVECVYDAGLVWASEESESSGVVCGGDCELGDCAV